MKAETQATHTPGPWTTEWLTGWSEKHNVNYQYSPEVRILNPSGTRLIATAHLVSPAYSGTAEQRAESEANARLIAAAPELLGALKDAEIIYAEYIALGPKGYSQSFELVTRTIGSIRAAIARTEGR